MARARNIKPAFFKNEDLAGLPFEYRLLFVGLWCLADREGRLEDRPTRIRMEIFPADNVDVECGLRALAQAGFVLRYEVEGAAYIQVSKFSEHQTPHYKEAPTKIPKPRADPRQTLGEPRVDPGQAPGFSSSPGLSGHDSHDNPGKALGSEADEGGVNPSDSLILTTLNTRMDEGKTHGKPRANPRQFALPEWIPPEAWGHFEEMRKKIKKPMTDRACELIVLELGKLRDQGHDPQAVLEQSVRLDYQDVYAIKGAGPVEHGPSKRNGHDVLAEWWGSEPTTIKQGEMLGMAARPGESINDFRGRIRERLSQPEVTA